MVKMCPLLSISAGSFEPCQQEKCAWWMNSSAQCAIKELGIYAYNNLEG